MPTSSTSTHPHDAARPHAHPADRWRRPLAALLASGGVSLLGTGAFASWQATASASSASLDAANAALSAIDATGGQLAVSVTNLLPGDYLYRYVDVTNAGTVPVAAVQTATASGQLAGALVVTADVCSVAWTTGGSTPGGTCSGTTTALGPVAASLASPVTLATTTINGGAVQRIRYRVGVDPNAASTYMGKSATVVLSSTGDLVGGGRDRTTS